MKDNRELIELALAIAAKALEVIETEKGSGINEAVLVDDLRRMAQWAKCGAGCHGGGVRPLWAPGDGSEIDRIVQRWGPT